MTLNAIFNGASSLRAETSAIDVIGQNLSNLNTTGFKDQSVNFKDVLYQTLNAGSGPNGNDGGTNPYQFGSGVQIGGVVTQFIQGPVTPTGIALDAAIQGKGFFQLKFNGQTVFSRNGEFSIDSQGFLIDPNTGARVQRTGNLGEPGAAGAGLQTPGNNDISIPFGATAPGIPTSNVTFQGNISNSTGTGGTVPTSIQIFDTQSNPQTLTVTFTETGVNTYTASATVTGGGTVSIPANAIAFNSTGILTTPASGALTATITNGGVTQTINLNLGTPGQTAGLTQLGGTTTATAVTQNGSGIGSLTGTSYDTSGVIEGQFSNGRNIPIAQLAIASFNNESGLLKQGNNYYLPSPASGAAIVGTGGAGGNGTITGSALEGSNVDITRQFTSLIIAQRAFQANSQTITVGSEVLQSTNNIFQ